MKQLVPNWIKQFTAEGKSLDEAVIHDFFIDHPMVKYPYITSGEITKTQVDELVEKCKTLNYLP